MTAEIRDKSVSLISRSELIEIFDRDNVMISVHEHLDQEELFFDNGKSIFYSQSLQEFADQFSGVPLTTNGNTLETFCAAFFSCPIYERFRAIELVRKAGGAKDIYFDANNRVLEEIGVLQQAFKKCSARTVSGNVPFLPLPFLFVDPNVSASDFEQQYASVLDKTAGLKWHPYAQRHEPKDYVRSGYIDLAAEYGLPTVIHCERPGEKGDLSALFRDVSSAAERAKVAIDIAHMGFLHADLDRISDFEYSYTDISPWSAITTAKDKDLSVEGRAEALAEHLTRHSGSMLFGMDTPFNWLLWSSGDKYGADVKQEIQIVQKAVELAGEHHGAKLLNKNPRRFLKAMGCEL